MLSKFIELILVEKIKYFLDHPDEAKAIGQRAKIKVQSEHTCSARVRSLIEVFDNEIV